MGCTSTEHTSTSVALLTFVWFAEGLLLLHLGNRLGYVLTLSFPLVNLCFYLFNEIDGSIHGYGPVLHLTNFRDPILWVVLLIGYLNFFAAGYFAWVMIGRRRLLVRSDIRLPASQA